MQLSIIIDLDRICCGISAASKKRALELLSELLASGASDQVTSNAVFDRLIARERLGSTGLGFGVAIPHGRISRLDAPVGAFLSLESGVDFAAPDADRVDLVFGLLVPEESTDEHLQILSRLAELFNEAELRCRLREASSAETVLELFAAEDGS